jgi:hypothetical protein
MENKYNVTESLLRLVRVMRRKPTEHGRHSHGVGKLIRVIIIRTRDEKDLRVMRVSISEFGLLEMKRHEEEKRQSFDDLAECLNQEEQKTFCELCDRLASHAEKVNHEYQAQGAPHDHHHAADEHHGYHHLHHGPGNHRFREER